MRSIFHRQREWGPRIVALLAMLVSVAALASVASAQVCAITGDLKLCGDSTGEICGPPGMVSYSWVGPGGFTANTQCISVSVEGVYELTITDSEQNSVFCSGNVVRVPLPTCTITPTSGTSLCATGSVELCGPADMAEYKWTGPNDFSASTRCITVSVPGTYILTIADVDGCESTCDETVTDDGGGICSISGDRWFCAGGSTELCGPADADSYSWSGPGGFTAGTRCITVGVAGTYELAVGNGNECTDTCSASIEERVCQGDNCPRTPGFWTQQCEQRDGGSTKFDRDQMDDITACVDDASAFFDWAGDFDAFCAVVDPSGRMDIRKQTLRHYAVLLANACTGQLGFIANNGETVTLDLDTEIDCDGLGDVDTIGELIEEAEERLADLDGEELTHEVKSAYEQIKNCMDDVNNGRGIGPTCGHDDDDDEEDDGEGDDGDHSADDRGNHRGGKANLTLRVSPNPFNGSVTIGYAVPAQGDAVVSLAIYDVAGRMVRQLVSGTFAPGAYTALWNGRDESGRTAASGVYYARAQVGELQAVTRVLLVQ